MVVVWLSDLDNSIGGCRKEGRRRTKEVWRHWKREIGSLVPFLPLSHYISPPYHTLTPPSVAGRV